MSDGYTPAYTLAVGGLIMSQEAGVLGENTVMFTSLFLLVAGFVLIADKVTRDVGLRSKSRGESA